MEKTVAILMADLTGYTAMTDVHGGESAAKIVHKYMQLVDKSLSGATQLVQRIGDQVVLMSENPLDILLSARQLNESTQEEHQFLSIHAGIHYGPVFLENGNLFGSTINIASRIMNLANRGQIICSSAFVNSVGAHPGVSFKSFGIHKLKNVMNEVEVFELSTNASPALPVDPVCHMLIDPGKEHYTFTFQEKTFHFCSTHCLDIFKTNPESFANLD